MFEVFLPAVPQWLLITADSVLFIAKPEFEMFIVLQGDYCWWHLLESLRTL